MKKIYLLLATLFGLFISVSASAQDEQYPYGYDVDEPIVTDASQFYSPFSQNDLGNTDGGNLADGVLIDDDASSFWHSCWAATEGRQVPAGPHYLQIEIPDWVEEGTDLVLRFTRRNASNDHTTEWSICGTNDFVDYSTKDECEELAYLLTPYGSNTETVTTEPFSTGGYKYIRLYSMAQTGSDYGSRTYWHVSELNLYTIKPLTEWEAVNNELIAIADEYSYYLGTFELGDAPGQYSEEKYIAFEDAYNALVSISDDDPVERLKEVIQNLKDAYQALLDSKVTFALESGYYHIRAGMEYVNNVVVGQDEEGNDITEEQVRDKYMMGHKQDGVLYGIWGTPEDFAEETQKIRPLFKITRINGLYDIQSMMYDARFTTVERSKSAVMDPNSESLMALDPVATTEEGITYVNIRVSTQNANDYFYLHQGGHSNGTGKNGFLVGWSNTYSGTPAGSEWYFEPVDAAEAEAIIAEWAPNKDRVAWLERYHKMYASADSAITAAKDVSQIAVVTDAAQFSSPFSQNDLGNKDGGNLSDGVLIDGDAGTFWHSCWAATGENVVPEGNHYLQIELTEDITAPLYLKFTRRSTSNDHTTVWSIRGTNEAEYTTEEECEELLNCETPFSSNTETLTTPTFEAKGYKYIRLYSEAQHPSTHTYWHASELNLFYDQENPHSQYSSLGEIATNLEAVLKELADVADDDLTDEQYQKLETAWNAFLDAFVDPAELRQALADVAGLTDQIAVGTQPGFWPDNSTAEALNKTIADATAYDAAGKYNKAQSTTYIETLEAQADAFMAAANPIKEGKWYRIRFGTEEEYAEHEWPTTGNDANVNTEKDIVIDEALFGKYFTVAGFDQDEDGAKTVFPVDAEEVTMNDYIFLDADEDIEEKDMSLWRFIAVGDSGYAIQNKATGLFMVKKPSTGYILLGVHPAIFTQKIVGWGQQAFLIKTVSGETMNPLHAALSYNIVTTYRNYGNSDGRRGCFFVEEYEDVAADYSKTDFNMNVIPGELVAGCYPMDLTCTDDEAKVWTVGKVEGNTITLGLIDEQKIEAGRPFILLKGTTDDYDAEADAEKVAFTHGMDIFATPDTINTLRGSFTDVVVGAGVAIPSANHIGISKSPSQKVAANGVWIVSEAGFDTKTAVEIVFDQDAPDGITTALQNVSRNGAIYTIDGRLVSRKGNLNSMQSLPKGTYILNGTKVMVK